MSLVLKLSKCRLCLKLGDFYSIFASDSSIQLANMAMACSDIKISEGDGLPDKICGECIEKLSSAYIFKQQCERSDTELRRTLLNNSGSTEISSYGRRNSDSGFSNRTDCSTSKKDVPQRPSRGKKSTPDKSSISSEVTLLKESYSVDVRDPLSYEGLQAQQHHSKARSSDSRSNSPAVSELARFQCQRCNKTYLSAKTLRNHSCKKIINLESDDHDDKSSQDSFKIVKTETIVNPEVIKTTNSELTCDVCGQQFKFNIMLKRHQLVCQAPAAAPEIPAESKLSRTGLLTVPLDSLQCPICKKLFKKRIYAIRHLRRSSCNEIAKNLAGGATLVANRPKQNKAKPSEDAMAAFQAECSICTARFSSHMLMFKHFQLCFKRRGPAPIVCKVCNTSYSRVQGLYKHIRVHHLDGKKGKVGRALLQPKVEPVSGDEHRTAAGKLKCRECEKTFEDQGQLVMHLAAHMANINEPTKVGIRPAIRAIKGKARPASPKYTELECKECYKKFRYKASFRAHLQTHHDYSVEDLNQMDIEIPRTVACDLCDRKFRDNKALRLHKINSHSIIKSTSTETILNSDCPMKCLLCDIVVMGNARDKKDHNLMHIGKNEKPRNEYSCPACHEVFKNSKEIGTHIARHNSELNKSKRDSLQQEAQEDEDDQGEDVYIDGDPDGFQDEQVDEDNDEEINAMDFCESVVANIKQEDDYGTSTNNKTVNLSPSSRRGPVSVVSPTRQKLVVALGGFTCALCNTSVDTYMSYQEHMKQHQEGGKVETKNKCVVCEQEFKFDFQLKKHIKEHIDAAEKDPSVLACKECGRANKNFRAFIAHNNWHMSMKELKCHICLRQFAKRGILMTHFKKKHASRNEILDPIEDVNQSNEVTPYQCPLCNKYLKTAVSLTCHTQWHSSKSAGALKRYQCSQCSFAFTSKSRFALHLRKHNQNVVTPFRCDKCGLYFTDNRKLMFHVRGHKSNKTLTKRFRCPVCEALFPNMLKVQRHIQRSHPESKMVKKKDPGADDLPKIRHICKVCGKEFSTAHKLKYHGERHTRKPTFFICSLCGKRNISRKLHTLHIKGHMYQKFKDNPLQCGHCEKKFVRRHDLHVHMYEAHDIVETYTLTEDDRKKWDGSKEYQCHVCFKTLAKESTYLRHLDYHNAMRCNYCLKYFNSKVFMDAHVAYDCDRKKVLNGSDPFEKKLKCSDCYKAFSLPIKLRCHLRTQHHKELKVQAAKEQECATCDFCFTTFDSKVEMEKHKNIHSRVGNYWGCQKCPKKFATVSLYLRHIKSHIHRYYTENPLQCEDCQEKFIYYNDYSSHLKSAHNKEVDWIVPPQDSPDEECRICKKTFSRLHNHMMYHERFRCKKCHEYFAADYLYESHVCPIESDDESPPQTSANKDLGKLKTNNAPIEPYQECEFCFKPYTSSYTAGLHNTTHTKLLQFSCLYCDKTFTSISSFKMHAISHRFRHYKDNPLLCKHCGEKFIKYGLYIRHLRSIHNEKESMILRPSYPSQECKICKKTFKNMHYHYRFHKQFQCNECKKYILSEKLFNSHKCNNPNEDKSLIVECDEDITPEMLEGKFDYSTLRHRPIDKVADDKTTRNNLKDFPDIDISENELSNSVLSSIDVTNMSTSPDITESNQDMIVSIPDQVVIDKYLNVNNKDAFGNFTPIISSTVSLCNPPELASNDACDVSMENFDDDSQNARCDLGTISRHVESSSRIIETSAEIQKIVDDLESSFPIGDDTNSSEIPECIDLDSA